MEIQNEALTSNEKQWLKFMFSKNFLNRDELIAQINHAKIHREYTEYFLSLHFTAIDAKPVHLHVRVPIEMRLYQDSRAPVQFFLHVVQGYVSELEIFYADSSQIDLKNFFETDHVEILLDSEVIQEAFLEGEVSS